MSTTITLPIVESPVPSRSPEIIRAVDFENLIIHADRYTWETWDTFGRRTYPVAYPIQDTFINAHTAEFSLFTDMRE